MTSALATAPVPRRRWPPWAAVAVDVALAAITFLATVAMLGGGHFEDGGREIDGLGVGLAALTALPLLWRRRRPLVVFPLIWVPTIVLYSLEYSLGPPIGSMIALYEVAASGRHSRRQAFVTALVVAGALGLFLVVTLAAFQEFPTGEFLGGLVTWGASWYVGDRVRLRRERLEAQRERLERALHDVERERRLAAAEERTRIARDLHDSAGHAINVILVQAGAARLLQDKDPAGSRQAIETIEDVARETIGDIDRMVRMLRGDAAGGDGVEPPTGLSALEGLVERQRAGGLDVHVEARGTPRALAASVDGAAYRILQEALTNAAVHGRGSARVEVAYGPEALELTVTNPTREADSRWPGGGHGIVGMRERAGLLGGTIEVESREGVFRVRARLPYVSEDA
jgi:signal transduction histidine kinase